MPAEYLFAGKYAAFVLPAYGVTALGLGGAIMLSWHTYRRAGRKLAEVEKTNTLSRAPDASGAAED
ncbi:MAG: heme exporter protein CcmD [Alphaproteobacteria bacterium]|nr:heme exporter protein CcmD [Alphaproteobacteria bacterium]